jgi:nucleotide-binding universal stress UspA family protein
MDAAAASSAIHVLLVADAFSDSLQLGRFLSRFPLPRQSHVSLLAVPPRSVWGSRTRRSTGRIDDLFSALGASLAESRCSVRELRRTGPTARRISDAIGETRPDLLVVESRSVKPLKRLLVRSVAHEAAKAAPCSVLVVKDDLGSLCSSRQLPLRILVAHDGSEPSTRSLELLASLPLEGRAEVMLVSSLVLGKAFRMDILIKQLASWREEEQAAQERLEEAAQFLLKSTSHVATQLREGPDESKEILKAGKEFNADLIVVCDTARNRLEQRLLRSVSSRLLQHAPCSVMIFRC